MGATLNLPVPAGGRGPGLPEGRWHGPLLLSLQEVEDPIGREGVICLHDLCPLIEGITTALFHLSLQEVQDLNRQTGASLDLSCCPCRR